MGYEQEYNEASASFSKLTSSKKPQLVQKIGAAGRKIADAAVKAVKGSAKGLSRPDSAHAGTSNQ